MTDPFRHRSSWDRPRCLTFTPLAWLKLQWFCHAGPTEVGGFGISAGDELLVVEDFITLGQDTTSASVRFRDEALADFFDRCIDAGLSPQRFARIWCHTHPADSVTPSGTDEDTFARVFGACDWSVMFILGRTGKTYARLAFAAGPGAAVPLPVAVDWSAWPAFLPDPGWSLDSQIRCWQQEYAAHVHPGPELISLLSPGVGAETPDFADGWPSWAEDCEFSASPPEWTKEKPFYECDCPF
jgi:hypothetical protein